MNKSLNKIKGIHNYVSYEIKKLVNENPRLLGLGAIASSLSVTGYDQLTDQLLNIPDVMFINALGIWAGYFIYRSGTTQSQRSNDFEKAWKTTYSNPTKATLFQTALVIPASYYLFKDSYSEKEIIFNSTLLTNISAATTYTALSLTNKYEGIKNLINYTKYKLTMKSNFEKAHSFIEQVSERSTNPFFKIEKLKYSFDKLEVNSPDFNSECFFVIENLLTNKYDKKASWLQLRKLRSQQNLLIEKKEILKDSDKQNLEHINALLAVYAAHFNQSQKVKNLIKSNYELNPNLENKILLANVNNLLQDELSKKESEELWSSSLDEIIKSQEFIKNSKKISQTNNSVYELNNSLLSQHTFIIKEFQEEQTFLKEKITSQFLCDLLGYKKLVAKPLFSIKKENKFYLITKRIKGITLKDTYLKNSFIDSKTLNSCIEKIIDYQTTANYNLSNLEDKGLKLNEMGYLNEFKKFLCSDKKQLPKKDKYGNLEGIEKNLMKIYEDNIVKFSKNCNKVFIHGDYHPGNIILDNLKNICIIDSENSKLGIWSIDIANLIDHIQFYEIIDKDPYFNYAIDLKQKQGVSMPLAYEELILGRIINGVRQLKLLFKNVEKYEPEINLSMYEKAKHFSDIISNQLDIVSKIAYKKEDPENLIPALNICIKQKCDFFGIYDLELEHKKR
ncbi:phosphotransferase [Candidatus Woesearchaeota archaeon]|nr:phosphotransferase [Candidatus Woesearchaeota archaeon]MBT7368582.1 phosphotransferase [Candidatus Woesearchaeota archaeon]